MRRLDSPKWVNLTINASSGFTTPSGNDVPQGILIDGVMYFRGVLTNSTFSGGFTTIGAVPAPLGVPTGTNGAVASATQNTNVISTWRVFNNRDLQVYMAATSSAWLSLSQLSYPVA